MKWYHMAQAFCMGWLAVFIIAHYYGMWWAALFTLPIGVLFLVSMAYATWKDD
jgi:hypothetical protein